MIRKFFREMKEALTCLFDDDVYDDDSDFSTSADCYEDLHNDEVSDPYLRIDVLEHEIRGYLAQIDTLHEIIYSLRNSGVKHPNGGSDLRGTSHSSPTNDNGLDCA